MKAINSPPFFTRQFGLSLVELMVSVVIGLILLGAMTYILLGSKKMGRADSDVSRMQESGRYAMEIMGKAIRQAGYRLDTSKSLGATASAPNGVVPVDGTHDTITLRHDPAWMENANSFYGEEMNCAGGKIISDGNANAVNSKLVVYTFSVVNGQLRCATVTQSNTATSQVVADGVDDMEISYGLDTNGNGVITSYVTNLFTDTMRRQVAAVRVNLLVKGTAANTAANNTQTVRFNGANVTYTDGFLRQVFSSTFTVRNQAQ